VSKSDLSDLKTVKALTARLGELNPRAVIDVAVKGDLDPKCLIDTGQADAIERHSGFIAEASHSDGIQSFVMRSDTPWEWPVFHRAMETLITLRGPDLLRIKGLLNLKGSKGPVVFQAVQHLMHPPVELSAWPDTDNGSRVVFITRGVTEQQVQELFAACQALGYVTGE
jgi:G3E family GTPase